MKTFFQTLKYNNISLFAAVGGLLLLLAVTACSEKKAPDVPKVQSDLLFETLNDLERKEYESALPKLKRYSEINSTNDMIDIMINQVIENAYVVQVRDLLDQGKINEADKLMKSMLEQHGSRVDNSLPNFVDRLKKADQLIEKLAPIQNAATMKYNADELLAHVKTLPHNRAINVYAKRKSREAEELRKIEDDRKIVWPWLDALEAKKNGDQERFELLRIYLAAQLDGFRAPMVRDLTPGK